MDIKESPVERRGKRVAELNGFRPSKFNEPRAAFVISSARPPIGSIGEKGWLSLETIRVSEPAFLWPVVLKVNNEPNSETGMQSRRWTPQ